MLALRLVAFGAMAVTCTFALGSSGCMVHHVPPPPAPNAELPPAPGLGEEEARPPNTSRVTITTDIPARVVHNGEVYQLASESTRRRASNINETICERTPCTITLEYGHQELRFIALGDDGRTSTTIVPVYESRVAVNHTLGQHRSSKGRVVGALVVLAGAALVGIGLGLDDAPRARAIGIGVAAAIGGGFVWGLSHETVQEGATTQWSPQPTPAADGKSKGPVLGTSFGFRF